MLPALFFLLSTALAMQALFWFYVKFEVFFFQFCEEGHWQPDGGSIKSVNYFEQYGDFHDTDSS